jgi:hypothetical protein
VQRPWQQGRRLVHDCMCVPQVAEAKKDGNVLRYAATLEGGTCKVGLTVVSANSPLGRLSGTANLVEFLTEFYSPNPLVIQVRARSHTHSELVSCACGLRVGFVRAFCVLCTSLLPLLLASLLWVGSESAVQLSGRRRWPVSDGVRSAERSG